MENILEINSSTKQRKGILFLIVPLVLVFGYIVSKEVTLPYAVLAGIVLVYGFILFLSGLSAAQIITYVLVAYLPFSKQIGEDFGHFGSAFNFTNILVGLGLITWAKQRWGKREPIVEKTSLNLPVIIFVLIGMSSIFRYALYGGEYIFSALINYLQRWLIPVLLYFWIVNTVKNKQMIKNLIILIMIATLVVALMASLEYLTVGEGDLDDSRISGVADNPNLLAAFFSYYMFLFLGFFLVYFNRVWYWFLLFPFLVCFRGIMVTFSRAGYLAFVVGSAAAVFFRKKILFLLLLISFWLVWQNPDYLPSGVRYRLGQTIVKQQGTATQTAPIENSLEQSARTRVGVWKGALWMIRDHPIMGVGYNLFETKITHYWVGGSIDAHNTYLLIASEMGVPALLIFLWILAAMFWTAYRLYRSSTDSFSRAVALGFIGGMFGFLVSNLFGSRLDSHEVSSYFWILAALVARLKLMEESKVNS